MIHNHYVIPTLQEAVTCKFIQEQGCGGRALFEEFGEGGGGGSAGVQGQEEGAALVHHAQPRRGGLAQLYQRLEERHLRTHTMNA